MSDVTTALEQQATALTSELDALVVTDAASFAAAGEALKTVATYIRRVGEVLDPIVQAANMAHKVAVAQREGLLAPARLAKERLGLRMATWEQQERERRRLAELAAQRERARLEAEARAQAEAEQRRLQAEAESRRLEEAAALEAQGDHAGAAHLIAAPVAAPVVIPAPIFQPRSPAPPPPKVEGVSFRDEWDFRIVDESRIPREYLIVDEKKIRAVVKAMRQGARIPGVEVFARRVSAVRTA